MLALVGPTSVVLCAALAATSVSSLVETLYFDDTFDDATEIAAQPQPAPGKPADTVDKTAKRIAGNKALVERNMFCSGCSKEEPPTGDSGLTALPLRLIATNLAGPGSHSFASVVNTETQRQGAYRLGHRIPGAGIIENIGADFLEFRNESSQSLERLVFSPEEKRQIPEARASAAGSRRTSKRSRAQQLVEEYVRSTGKGTFEVDRRLIGELRGNPMLAGARATPVVSGGQVQGFKLYGVRSGSLAHSLGVRNGDQISKVNGTRLTSLDAVVATMGRLADDDHWSIELTRRGKPVELRYRLR
jgi:general secretion pathway protein C